MNEHHEGDKEGKRKRSKVGAGPDDGFDAGPVKIIWIKFIENQQPNVVKRVYFRARPNGTSGAGDLFCYFEAVGNKASYDKLIADFVSGAVGAIYLTLQGSQPTINDNYLDEFTFAGGVSDTIPSNPFGNTHGMVTVN